jgi:hypothetical protein
MTDLRAELEDLRRENARLRKLLKLTDSEAAPARGAQTAWIDKAPAQVRLASRSPDRIEAVTDLQAELEILRQENAQLGEQARRPIKVIGASCAAFRPICQALGPSRRRGSRPTERQR